MTARRFLAPWSIDDGRQTTRGSRSIRPICLGREPEAGERPRAEDKVDHGRPPAIGRESISTLRLILSLPKVPPEGIKLPARNLSKKRLNGGLGCGSLAWRARLVTEQVAANKI